MQPSTRFPLIPWLLQRFSVILHRAQKYSHKNHQVEYCFHTSTEWPPTELRSLIEYRALHSFSFFVLLLLLLLLIPVLSSPFFRTYWVECGGRCQIIVGTLSTVGTVERWPTTDTTQRWKSNLKTCSIHQRTTNWDDDSHRRPTKLNDPATKISTRTFSLKCRQIFFSPLRQRYQTSKHDTFTKLVYHLGKFWPTGRSQRRSRGSHAVRQRHCKNRPRTEDHAAGSSWRSFFTTAMVEISIGPPRWRLSPQKGKYSLKICLMLPPHWHTHRLCVNSFCQRTESSVFICERWWRLNEENLQWVVHPPHWFRWATVL